MDRGPAPTSRSRTTAIGFGTRSGRPTEAAFDDGRLSGDDGLPWLAEADRALGRLVRRRPARRSGGPGRSAPA
jgi:hypothetical protein